MNPPPMKPIGGQRIRWWRGLRMKAALAIVFGFLVAGIPGVFVAGWASVVLRERIFSTQIVELTRANTEHIEGPIARELGLSERFAHSLLLRRWMEHEDDPAVNADFFTEAEGFRQDFADHSWFAVVDKSLHSYFHDEKDHAGTGPVETYTHEKDPWYFDTIRTTDDYSVNVDVEPTVHVTKVWFNVIVRDGDRKIGIAGSGLDLAGFVKDFVATKTPGVTPMLINDQGYIVVHPDPAKITFNASSGTKVDKPTLIDQMPDDASRATLKAALADARAHPGKVTSTRLPIDGANQLVGIDYVAPMQAFVLTTVNLNQARIAGPNWWVPSAISLLVLTLLMTIFGSASVGAIVLRPLRRLHQSALAMAGGDYDAPLPKPSGDEIGSLSAAFNSLAQQVRRHTDELEGKVQERTAALEGARDEATQASRAKSDFLANMSHEIRTPINAIAGFSALALRTELNPTQAGYLEQIRAATLGLSRIVNDLLDFSKIEAGHLDMESIPFPLSDLIDAVTAHIGPLAEGKGLELLVDIAPEAPTRLVGDPYRLTQVLTNLCGNAVKFTERGEIELRIDVEARAGAPEGNDRATMHFAVRDTGIGLEPEQAARLFQPFTQADASTTRRFGGTGLGLVICQRLVEMMDGRIWLESQPGIGTTVHVRMALPVASTAAEEALPTLPAGMAGQPALVVDDNANARQILSAQLAELGMKPDTAATGTQAVDKMRQATAAGRPYPLVLMDWRMPGLDGIATTRVIREDSAIAGTPVIIMVTAFGRETALAAVEETGLLDGVLLKPVTPVMLAETLHRLRSGAAPAERSRQVRAAAALPGTRLLLVEDNPVNQQLARELLEQEGAEVSIAENGQVALALLDERGPAWFDAALVDLQMPVMDGYATARAVRQRPDADNLPLIAMTAHAMHEDRERCLAAGMQDHLPKPIDPELLVDRLTHWIGAERLRAAAIRYRPAPRRAPTPPAVPSASELPSSLPGIDTADGLKRCGGDGRLYADLLGQFHEIYGDAAAEFARLRAAGKAVEAHRLVHTVKGAAANLGMLELAAAAAALEDALEGERD